MLIGAALPNTEIKTRKRGDKLFIKLPSRLDLLAAEALKFSLIELLSENSIFKVDPSKVDKISAPCLQVLLAFYHTAQRLNPENTFMKGSPTFENTIDLLGLRAEFDL
jgi:chemotaxis protein CheX